jgi:hypothetical protein
MTLRAMWISCLLGAAAMGCGSKSDGKQTASAAAESVESVDEAPATDVDAIEQGQVITQKVGDTNVSWLVKPSGDVFALVKQNGKEIPASDLDGKVTMQAFPTAGAPVEMPLKSEGGLLTANVGPLAGTVNEMKYDLVVEKKLVSGVLHVPKAGTEALIDEGEIASKAKFGPGTLGPHQGVVQVVDEHVVEIVGQKGGGQIRVYFLDDDLKEVKVGDQKMKLALYGGKTVWVDLKVGPGNAYFYGEADLKVDPSMITVVCEEGNDVDVVLVDYLPGHVVVWGPSAHVFGIYVVANWDVVVVGSPHVVVYPGKHKKKHKKWKH